MAASQACEMVEDADTNVYVIPSKTIPQGISAAIMFILRKTTDDAKLLSILEARYRENKNNPKKQSGLAARLAAMQKQQQEMQRKREELDRKRNDLNKRK